jgi:hypothetical protein
MRRGWILLLTLIAVCLTCPVPSMGNPSAGRLDSDLLFAFIQKEDQRDPLVAFGKTENRVDETLSRENRAYLGRNQDLLARIRAQLASDSLQWKLAQASTRLMIVPERRPTYAALFENYCQAAVDFVLHKTRLPDPYRAIATFRGEAASQETASDGEGGITAYLVHNIADVYTEEYVFTAAGDGSARVKIKLSNRNYTGEVGSYSSYLVIGENQQYEFVRSPYTLWRNSADDPLNVLIAPIEETLHIALRHATEDAIKRRLLSQPSVSRPVIDRVVEEWLAVEEAAVGGLVRKLMPEIITRFLTTWPREDIDATLHARRAFDKYRYLQHGVRIVEELGIEVFIDLYRNDPQAFRTMLVAPPNREDPSDVQVNGNPTDPDPTV